MSGRLSHRPGGPGKLRRGHGTAAGLGAGPWLEGVLGLGLAGLLLLTLGCSGGEASSEAANRRAADATDTRDDPAESSFVWPEDPDAPLLSIEIEGSGIEGTIEIELMPELAPESVAHVLSLARDGSYDGTTFHRVIPGFMIQGGDPYSRDRDPSNDGLGEMGERIEDEHSEAPFVRGVVALANRGRRDTSGSQLFIMQADHRALDGRYNVIGRVRTGMDVVDAIAEVETDTVGRWGPKDRPIENVVVARARALGPGPEPARPIAEDEIAATDD